MQCWNNPSLVRAAVKDHAGRVPRKSGVTVASLRALTHLEWRITHRKKLGKGVSVLRYAVTADRAGRILDRIESSPPPVGIKSTSETDHILTVEVDLLDEGFITIEVMFDGTIDDDFSDL